MSEPPKDFGPDSDEEVKVQTHSAPVEEENPYLVQQTPQQQSF